MENPRKKDANRFKFIPFAERIANINVDIFHRVSHRNEDEEEEAEQKSYFHLAMEKWTLLNRTKEWLEFKKLAAVGGIYTLPQVLNQKQKIAQLFIDNISKQTEFSLQPVLELLIAFVKDLRQEFYEFYSDILRELIKLLRSRNPETIEQAFVCLAYIFKYLVRNLVKDLDKVLIDLAPLLDDSLPEYIRDFAAQSFAFVARRVKDKRKFLNLVLAILQENPQLTAGCGKLITETIHGIKGQPHSTAVEMLENIFHGFGDRSLPQNLLAELSSHVVQSYVIRIDPKHSNILHVINEVLNQKTATPDDALFVKGVRPILVLVLEILRHRSGIHLRDPTAFSKTMLSLIALEQCSLSGRKLLGDIFVQMLTATNIKLPQDIAVILTTTILNESKEVMIPFIESTVDYGGFEAIILPHVLQIFETPVQKSAPEVDILQALAKVVEKKAYKSGSWSGYRLEFKGTANFVPGFVLERLMNVNEVGNNNVEEIASYLLLLPNMTPLNHELAVKAVTRIIVETVQHLQTDKATLDVVNLFLLYLSFESLSHLQGNICDGLDLIHLLKTLEPFYQKSVLAFKTLEILLNIMEKHNIEVNIEALEAARQQSIARLTSPYHMTRAIALRILIHLETLNGSSKDNNLLSIVETCLEAEMVPITVHDYREAVKFVSKLHRERVNADQELLQIPLRFLLGFLFSNFSLLEQPIREAIASYFGDIGDSTFTPVKEQLALPLNQPNIDAEGIAELPSFLAEHIKSRVYSDDRPDFQAYKVRVWKVINAYPISDEKFEALLIDMGLDIFRTQIMRSHWQYSSFNINRTEKKEDITIEKNEEGIEDDESSASHRLPKTLIYEVLSTLSKLRSKHKEIEIRKLCMDLLTDLDPQTRKGALECLLSRRTKKLQAYKANLLKFIDDTGFKDAMVHFQLDKESGALEEAHRPMLMPIILRLMYSKMVSSGPTHRGSKGSATLLRRTLVMRFLSGCHESEIEEFLKMAFKDFCLDPKDDAPNLITDRMMNVNLDAVVHPRKLLSGINLAEVVLERIGGLLSERLQKFLIYVVLSAAATVAGCLEKRDEVHSGYVATLKKVRGLCLEILAKIFDKFSKFPWQENDIDCLYRICVWPLMDRLHIEGIHSPTPLLKLFGVWSEYPRFFVLLARHAAVDETKTPLATIMDLLINVHCQKPVRDFITGMLEKLLTLKEDEPMETDELPTLPLQILNVRPIDNETISKLSLKQELNYGSQLLLPHVGSVLEYLRQQLAQCTKKSLTRVDTVVLARITEIATSPQHGDQLIGLLLRILATHPSADEEVLVNTLLTVKHLLAIVSQPHYYIRSLAVLFSSIELIQGRKVLINCVQDLANRCDNFQTCADIVRDLNAFDRRWIDQCDFNKRLDTFKLIRGLAAENQLTTDVCLFVIHTSFYFLRFEKDLSLRDSTELCLKEICPAILKLVGDHITDREIIIETLLKHIRAGVQGKDDRFKASAISLLGVLARKCPSSHFIFKDLSILTNDSDLEVDFFENIYHLQIYRRLRALHKFTSIVKTLTEPIAPRTMTQFIIPLATQFLCNETYAGKNTLVDAAIEAVGTASRLLPWHQYQTLLKYYLFKLRTSVEYQRQCVRLVIAILDSFHFDVSRSKELCADAPSTNDLSDGNANGGVSSQSQVVSEGENMETDVGEVEKIETETEEPEDLLEDKPFEAVEEVEEEEAENDGMEVEANLLIVEKVTILKPAAAARVQRAISGHLLEQLQKAIGQRTSIEVSHKLNRKSLGPDKDEEDILRVPIAVALVKLLQKLPKTILEIQLPGIFIKLCTFLKSHLESVRRVTRETLQQIMISLGPSRLNLLFNEMTDLLTKGFQVHVLVFTMHAVIKALQPQLRPGDLDENLPMILRVCSADLFGAASEEKTVVRIQVKYKEARSQKSFNLLHLVAQFITDKCLLDLILPIKQALSTHHSHKVHVKCRECLRQIVLGLALNSFVPPASLFSFLYGAASESIPQLKPEPPVQPKKSNPKKRPDSFLIAPEVHTRSLSNPVKNSSRSGAHIIVEFGLHLLMILLKQDKVKNMDLRPFLDPLVPILKEALDSQHVKVTTLAIKCLTRLLKQDLPSLREHIKPITNAVFSLLHKFAAAGLSKGDNFDLVLASFKIVSVIVRDVSYYTLSPQQLKALLLYAEQDIYDGSRQAVAFGLIKSILQRRLKADELDSVMLKISNLSISAEQAHVRAQARQTLLQYLMDYPLGNGIESYIGFYIGQLSYEIESGRQSALEMIFSFISSFPEKTLKEQSVLFFLTLGSRLVNDDSPDCKKMVSAVIKGLLSKLDVQSRDYLFEMVLIWMKQKKITHRLLAAQLAGVFVSFEKDQFERHLKQLLPLLKNQLIGDRKPGKFVKAVTEVDEDVATKDQLLYLVLVLLVKICANCPKILSDDEYKDYVAAFVDIAQNFLCHDHEWVRVGASQFLGSVLSSIKPNVMAAALDGQNVDIKFWNPETIKESIKSLILDHTSQFIPGIEINQDFTDQIMKNLVYFAKVLKDVSAKPQEDEEHSNETDTYISLPWLVRRMRRVTNLEIAHSPSSYTLRTAVLMWTGAVAVCLTKEELTPVLYNLIASVVREEEVAKGETTKSPIAGLVNDVATKLKKKVGLDAFAEQSVKLQTKLMEKRAKRKSAIAQEFVTDPERAVKRKMEKQLKKKDGKKLKREIQKGKKAVKYKGKRNKVKR